MQRRFAWVFAIALLVFAYVATYEAFGIGEAFGWQEPGPTLTVPSPVAKPLYPAYAALYSIGFPFLFRYVLRRVPKKATPWINLGLGVAGSVLFGIPPIEAAAATGGAALGYDALHSLGFGKTPKP